MSQSWDLTHSSALVCCCVEREHALEDALGVDPTQGMVQHVKLAGIVTEDDQIRRDSRGGSGCRSKHFRWRCVHAGSG